MYVHSYYILNIHIFACVSHSSLLQGTHYLSPAVPYFVQTSIVVCYAILSPSQVLQNHSMLFMVAFVAPLIRTTWSLLVSFNYAKFY